MEFQGASSTPVGSATSRDLVYVCKGGSFVKTLQGTFSNSVLMNLGPITCTNGDTIGAQGDGSSWPADTFTKGMALPLKW